MKVFLLCWAAALVPLVLMGVVNLLLGGWKIGKEKKK